MDAKLLSALGLCRRAGKTVIGTPMVCEAMRRGGKNVPVLVLEASDTSDNTHKRLTDKCAFYGVRHVRAEFSGVELAAALGKSGVCSAVAVTDKEMCILVDKYL